MSTPSSMVIAASFATTLGKTLEIAGASTVDFLLDSGVTFAAGSGAGQANAFWSDEFTVTTTTPTVNFNAPDTDVFGDSPTFTGIKAVIVKNTSATIALYMQQGAADGLSTLFDTASKGIIIAPSSTLILVSSLAAGWVASASVKNVVFKSASSTLTAQLMILGHT